MDRGRAREASAVAGSSDVEIRDGTEVRRYRVREVDGEERARLWDIAVAAFAPYAEYQTKTERRIPVFLAEPV